MENVILLYEKGPSLLRRALRSTVDFFLAIVRSIEKSRRDVVISDICLSLLILMDEMSKSEAAPSTDFPPSDSWENFFNATIQSHKYQSLCNEEYSNKERFECLKKLVSRHVSTTDPELLIFYKKHERQFEKEIRTQYPYFA